MPLAQGKGAETISANIAELVRAGHDPKQAAAIAYQVAGKDAHVPDSRPDYAKDMSDEDWNELLGLIGKWVKEEAAEPEHAQDFCLGLARMRGERIALDRGTVRRIDADGRLHVAVNNISKANVCPYYGWEIPNAEAMGLDRNRVYQLLRDPAELEKGAHTFNNLPLLSKHVPVSADKPEKALVVGSTGTDASFASPYLTNSLVVWDSSAIAGIETGDQRELSSAYRYVADMTPGVYEGVPFDGRMTQIVGNHVALVPVGRAGADVVVSDSLPAEMKSMKLSKKAARAALGALLLPQLAQDSAVTKIREVADKGGTVEQLAADAAKAFPDAKIDIDQLKNYLKLGLDEEPENKEDKDGDGKKAEDEDDEEARKKREQEEKDEKSKAAMDSMLARAKAETRAEMLALRKAEEDVRPLVGAVAAMDSAEAVYRFALDQCAVEHKDVHVSALPAMVAMAKKHRAEQKPVVAMDAATAGDFRKRFPKAGQVRKV